ncbi:GNAT family N-acetyltransferase [Micromonospora sp. NBC_01699]|uniref:GNAT family N-acetyltransferase n=1 Tax=Micromonospora sp. NBC_01699 TaxID=2975984 RepID=UPI002E2A9E6E|nr:GNAT family N-acetyltransferase [Micromonospora sp. NBC_01699]
MPQSPTTVSIARTSPEADDARRILRAYYHDIVGRYHGREATTAEVDSVLVEEPSDDLTPPGGLFWVVTDGAVAVGCAGLRLLSAGVGEVTRVFVAAAARRRGIGSLLLTEVETAARDRGLSRLRLDTRHDLVEARRLYNRHGYAEVEPFNDSPYAAHWFVKPLR